MWSITNVSTGPFAGSSFKPSCPWTTANIESGGSDAGELASPGCVGRRGENLVPSRENSIRISNWPAIPVLLNTGRPKTAKSMLEKSSSLSFLEPLLRRATMSRSYMVFAIALSRRGSGFDGDVSWGTQLPATNECSFGPPRARPLREKQGPRPFPGGSSGESSTLPGALSSLGRSCVLTLGLPSALALI